MNGEQLREAINVENERLRSAAKEKAKSRKQAVISECARLAEQTASSKEFIYKRKKRVEMMPSGIKVVEDDAERAKLNNKVMGGLADQIKQGEQAENTKIVLNSLCDPWS